MCIACELNFWMASEEPASAVGPKAQRKKAAEFFASEVPGAEMAGNTKASLSQYQPRDAAASSKRKRERKP